MKNQHGRITSLRSKISKNKIVFTALSLLLLVVAVCASTRSVYASAAFTYSDYTSNMTYTHNRSASSAFQEFLSVAPTRFNIEIDGTGTSDGTVSNYSSGNQNDIDIDNVYDLDGTIIFNTMNYRYGTFLVNYSSSFSLSGMSEYSSYSGYLDAIGTINFTCSNSNLTVIGVVPISINKNSTFECNIFNSFQRTSYSAVSFKYTGAFINAQKSFGLTPRIGINCEFLVLCRGTISNNNFDTVDSWFHGNVISATDSVSVNNSKVYEHSSTELAYLSSISNYLASILVVDNLTYTGIQNIYNSVDTLETLLASNTAAIQNAQTAIASLLTTANATQAEIDSFLQLLYARNHTDLDALKTLNHADLQSLLSKLETFRSEVSYSDNLTRALIVNQVDRIIDALVVDDSSSTIDLHSAITDYNTAESLASDSMSTALPNADSQISSITGYNYNAYYTDNVSAFSFWKSLGDYILNNSNLVGIGALLILLLFLGLVVYLLRL